MIPVRTFEIRRYFLVIGAILQLFRWNDYIQENLSKDRHYGDHASIFSDAWRTDIVCLSRWNRSWKLRN